MHCVVCLIFTVEPLIIHKYLQMFHSSFTICFIGFKLLMKYIFDYEFSTGHNFNERNEQIDTKSGQWFGATVASAGIDGPLVVSFIIFMIIAILILTWIYIYIYIAPSMLQS